MVNDADRARAARAKLVTWTLLILLVVVSTILMVVDILSHQ